MHTVLVRYALPKPVPRDDIDAAFRASESRFRGLEGLLRKYFCYDEANHTGYSVYLWETEGQARAFFNDAFAAQFREKFGAMPELTFVDTLMVVDNEQDKTSFG